MQASNAYCRFSQRLYIVCNIILEIPHCNYNANIALTLSIFCTQGLSRVHLGACMSANHNYIANIANVQCLFSVFFEQKDFFACNIDLEISHCNYIANIACKHPTLTVNYPKDFILHAKLILRYHIVITLLTSHANDQRLLSVFFAHKDFLACISEHAWVRMCAKKYENMKKANPNEMKSSPSNTRNAIDVGLFAIKNCPELSATWNIFY